MDDKEIQNIAKLRKYLEDKKIQEVSDQMTDRFAEVSKAAEANPKMANFLQKVDQISQERNIPKSNIFSQLMKRAAEKKSVLKSIPIVGGLVGLGSALSSGDAGAAVVDQVIPGGVEGLGPEKGSIDDSIENPQENPERLAKIREMLSKR